MAGGQDRCLQGWWGQVTMVVVALGLGGSGGVGARWQWWHWGQVAVVVIGLDGSGGDWARWQWWWWDQVTGGVDGARWMWWSGQVAVRVVGLGDLGGDCHFQCSLELWLDVQIYVICEHSLSNILSLH